MKKKGGNEDPRVSVLDKSAEKFAYEKLGDVCNLCLKPILEHDLEGMKVSSVFRSMSGRKWGGKPYHKECRAKEYET